MKFFIRACRQNEVEAILELWQQSDATVSVTDAVADIQRATKNTTAFLAAEIDGKIVGSIIEAFDGWRGNIYRLVVHPDYRRQGIARALVAEAGTRMTQQGAKRITALVEKDHPWATAFWEAAGYKLDSRMVRFVHNQN